MAADGPTTPFSSAAAARKKKKEKKDTSEEQRGFACYHTADAIKYCVIGSKPAWILEIVFTNTSAFSSFSGLFQDSLPL